MQDLIFEECWCNQKEAITSSTVNNQKTKEALLIIQFVLWRERCTTIFKEQTKTIAQMIRSARANGNMKDEVARI